MKIKTILYSFLLLAITACNEEDKYTDGSAPGKTADITTRASEDGVAVLIFRKQSDNSYKYTEKFTPSWQLKSANVYGASKTLLLGNYEFLFYKAESLASTTMTTLTAGTTKMDNISFSVKPNGSKAGYSLPVNEIWLPETSALAHTTYDIAQKTNREISAKITRAVSGIEVELKRGKKELDGTYTALPFAAGTNISSIIKSVTLDISKLGNAINITGGVGNTTKTYVTLNTSSGKVDTSTGFITLTGPFVFPNQTNENVKVDLSLTPVSTTDYPSLSTVSITDGKVLRNKKLHITVWFTATSSPTNHSIDIEVSYGPLGTPIDGDSGIWE